MYRNNRNRPGTRRGPAPTDAQWRDMGLGNAPWANPWQHVRATQGNGQAHDHHSHSNIVRHDVAKGLDGTAREYDYRQATTHELATPHDGYKVAVYFTTVATQPGRVRIQATNWRAEYEPNGWLRTEQARKLWAALRTAGFVHAGTVTPESLAAATARHANVGGQA